jgi:hypothetical protein
MTKEALNLALEALEADPAEMVEDENGHMVFRRIQAIITLREALANEALEKMAENARELGLDYEPAQDVGITRYADISVGKIIHNSPSTQRAWVGLTDEEIRLQWSEFWEAECHPWAIDFAQAIEAKLRSKNNG